MMRIDQIVQDAFESCVGSEGKIYLADVVNYLRRLLGPMEKHILKKAGKSSLEDLILSCLDEKGERTINP
jgi:hypothetical protein